MAASTAAGLEEDEWEICNDNGFVYKRRKRREGEGPPIPASHLPDDPEQELRNRRARKKRCLLSLRDKYRREMDQWELLSSALHDMMIAPNNNNNNNTAASSSTAVASLQPPQDSACLPLIEDLLFQVEAQEAILLKLSDSCDVVESMCKAQEESLAQSLMDLPVWASPRALMASLSD